MSWESRITEYFQQENIDITIYRLTGRNDIASIEDKIKKFRPEKVVAAGGDGTISLIAGLLLNKDIALGILPAGSANGMAKELGIPSVPEKAFETILNGTVRDADVIRINSNLISLHLSDIGPNARLIQNFDKGNMRGKLGYAKVVMKTLWRRTTMKVNITTSNRETEHDAEMVVLANASKYGTGAAINPGGNLFDGHFEVVIMHRLAFSELFKMWFRFRPFDPAKTKIFPATAVKIHTSRRVHFQVDGEYIGKVNDVQAEILPGQLKLIVP